MVTLPALDGVEHRFVDVGDGVTIHVADAGPADGPAVMLVHGFPQNWWEWHELIGPLAADGYRVLCPDLRGAGWSSAPRSSYTEDRDGRRSGGGAGPAWASRRSKLVAHDWGGPGRVHHDAAPSREGDRVLRDEYRGAVGEARISRRSATSGGSGTRFRFRCR